MPLYDYSCEACSHEFTVRRGFHDETPQLCPKCGAVANRQIHLPTIIYKGSGFYTTDYGGRRVPTSGSSSDDGGDDAPDGSSDGNGGSHADGSSDGEGHSHPHDF